MKKTMFMRILVLLLCMCLLPVSGFAQETDAEDFSAYLERMIGQTNDGTPVTHSDFVLSFHMNADGFPDDGLLHYRAWQDYVSRISLRGEMDSQSFPNPASRVYFNGGLYLDEDQIVPFEYDAYHSLRYLRSPALGGGNVCFQMTNFFEFMLKPYKYFYIPTQYAALIMYPEATVRMWEKYAGPMSEAIAGEGSRTVSYEALQAMCEKLNAVVLEDENNRAYFYVTSVLMDLGMDWTAMEKLACWDAFLAYLDPDMQGMTITETTNGEEWVIGGTTVYQKTVADGETAVKVYLPDPDGYEVQFDYTDKGSEVAVDVLILLDGEEYFCLSAGADGLPGENDTAAQGVIRLDLAGVPLFQEYPPIRVAYDYSRTARQLPYDMTLTMSLLSNQTGLPTLGFTYQAAVEEQPHTVLVDRSYEDTEDFFRLNEMIIDEYLDRFKYSVVLAAAPFAIHLPAGVISDVVSFMEEYGLLALVGIE
ncbi:MAG: hypothetical protein IKK75_13020 [Clostridia bacterium]|nr:hypothetical protein [Clostridia bacterium]